ncbi:MAG TPA: DUF2148 domain-containing protein [Acidobacteriota bacterium]|nr:DUF2148 domain-containing protein [Acidobacteriota bacterium]HQM61918.1 DUF2148 domain-containing protein [Acidobacteriota bacterium]
MALYTYDSIRRTRVLETARAMLVAARTAPKGRGIDNLLAAVVDGDEIAVLAETMRALGRRRGVAFFERDAGNLAHADAVVLLGTRIAPFGLKICGMCGFPDCESKAEHPGVPCVFNTGDLGIAVGSAVGVAADHRMDSRVMYTIGQAVKELGWLGPDAAVIYGIPLSATAKNPFFDRPPV